MGALSDLASLASQQHEAVEVEQTSVPSQPPSTSRSTYCRSRHVSTPSIVVGIPDRPQRVRKPVVSFMNLLGSLQHFDEFNHKYSSKTSNKVTQNLQRKPEKYGNMNNQIRSSPQIKIQDPIRSGITAAHPKLLSPLQLT
ncbi:hypothetical protein ACJJTC_015667 [Scirpophaga incertulas]